MTAFDPYLRHSVGEADKPLREAGPVLWSDSAGAWLVTRFADVSAVLRDPRFESFNLHQAFARITGRGSLSFPHLQHYLEASLIFVNDPDHRPLRRLLSRTLTSMPLSSLAPSMGKLARKLWRGCIARGECDIVRDYAEILPSMVSARLLGLDESERQAFFAATYGLMGAFNRGCSIARYRDFDARLGALRGTIDALFAERRRTPRADGLSRFLEEAASLGLSDDAAAANLTFLYLASVDQTSAVIGLGIRRLKLQPEIAAAVRTKALDEATLIEELIRIESPAPQVIRVATAAVEIGGVDIAAGDMLILLLSSANRDRQRYAEPHRVTPARPRHVAFSEGAHACIGGAFARVELAAALMPAIDRPPTWIDETPPEWWPLDATRRLRSLRVRFE